MFAFNPQVQDTSGQIQGQYNLQGSQAIANGISSLGQGIGGAIGAVGQGMEKQAATQGSVAALQTAVDNGAMKQATLDHVQSLPVNQQAGAIDAYLKILPSLYLAQHYNTQTDLLTKKQDASAGNLNAF